MTWYIKDRINKEDFVRICEESKSMSEAASKMKMHFNSFKRMALILNCYKTNQSGKGMKKKSVPRIPLSEILDGKHPSFQTYKLKNRLLKEGIFENKCSICGLDMWLDKEINCELDHIDGDITNHKKENLRLLCPNCYSQTSTFRGKNKIKNY